MNNIGNLFKVLGNNEKFNNYLENGKNTGKSNNEIIDDAINDSELMEILYESVSDIKIIMQKMDVMIGQKSKNLSKKVDKNVEIQINKPQKCTNLKKMNELTSENIMEDTSENILEDTSENILKKKYCSRIKPFLEPYNLKNTTWIMEGTFIEKLDNQFTLRMVTPRFECFY